MVKTIVKNLYELVVILKSNLSNDDLEKNIVQYESAIKSYGGSVVRVEEPVRRKFTHKIKSFKEGFYVSILFNSSPELPNTLKRILAIADDVLRYIIVGKENLK